MSALHGNPLTSEQHRIFKEQEKNNIQTWENLSNRNIELAGHKFFCTSSMFDPKVVECGTEKIAEIIPFPIGGSFLDIGTGCGVFAVLAAKAGCAHVLATDHTQEKVACAHRNVIQNEVDNVVTVQVSDVFDDIPETEKFDVIFWHHPYGRGEYASPFTHNLFDPNYELLRRYFRDGQKRLKPGGKLLIVNGAQIGDRPLFLQRAEEANLKPVIIGSIVDGEDLQSSNMPTFTAELFVLMSIEN